MDERRGPIARSERDASGGPLSRVAESVAESLRAVPRAHVSAAGALIDEASNPDPRRVLGRLLRRSARFDLAVSRIRLASIDFTAQDLGRVEACRVIVGGFDNRALVGAVGAAADVPSHARNLRALRQIIRTGRLELRSPGLWRWDPDFCLAEGPDLATWFPGGAAAMVGWLGLSGPIVCSIPRTACLVAGHRSTRRLKAGFERLWNLGHDILGVVSVALDAAPMPPA